MACYHPLSAKLYVEPSGKRKIFFSRYNYHGSNWNELEDIRIPCGKCIGCRLDRSLEWALRCEHESQLHIENSFVTLTYDDSHLPKDGSLRKRDLQLFFKRLRKKVGNERFRYFACGEYGGHTRRPHFHIILFGFNFSDRSLWSIKKGNFLYISDTLASVWTYGHHLIGEVTFESCAYVARYTCKKAFFSFESQIEDEWCDDFYGIEREPEFILMSRKPGIGHEFLKKYLTDIYGFDRVVSKSGRLCRPPRYYDSIYDCLEHNASYVKNGLKSLEELKLARLEFAKAKNASITEQRLAELEQVQLYKARKLKRDIE